MYHEFNLIHKGNYMKKLLIFASFLMIGSTIQTKYHDQLTYKITQYGLGRLTTISPTESTDQEKPVYEIQEHEAGLGRHMLYCDFFVHEDFSDHITKWLFNKLSDKNNNIIHCDAESFNQLQMEQHLLFEDLVHTKFCRVKHEVFFCINPIDNTSKLKHYRYILYTKDFPNCINTKLAQIFFGTHIDYLD